MVALVHEEDLPFQLSTGHESTFSEATIALTSLFGPYVQAEIMKVSATSFFMGHPLSYLLWSWIPVEKSSIRSGKYRASSTAARGQKAALPLAKGEERIENAGSRDDRRLE